MSKDALRRPNGQFAGHTLEAVYAEITRLDQLRGADQVALSAALLAAKTAVDAALAAAEKAVAAALIAAKEAVNKAELAQQRTNEGQNEFRVQLKDQAATLLTRNEYGLAHTNLEAKVDLLRLDIGALRSRLDVGPPSLAALQAESDRRGGGEGKISTATLIGAVGLAATIAGVVVGIIVSVLP